MTAIRPQILAALILAGAVLLASLLCLPSGMPAVIRTLLPAIVAMLVFLPLARFAHRALAERALAAEAGIEAASRSASQLRTTCAASCLPPC